VKEPGRSARLTALAAVLLLLASCASTRYIRTWVVDGADFTDTLTIAGRYFRLERISTDGTSTFAGSFNVEGDQWRFEIGEWTPAAGPVRRFDPPVVYLYRGRSFLHGLAFFSYRALTEAPMDQFIRAPGDFDEWE
jgi:hypothetical protein